MSGIAVQPPRAQGLRIALATDSFLPIVGGIERHIADLARALAAAGQAPVVLTPTPGLDTVETIPVRRLALPRPFGIALSPRLIAGMREELVRGRYDVLHAHVSIVSPFAYAAVLAARRLRLPTVVTFHSVLHAKAELLRALDALLGFSRWPVVISAVSERLAQQLARAAPRLAVEVLPNGIDPARWHLPARQRAPGAPITVVSAMRLHRKKRPLALLRAFCRAEEVVAARGRQLVLRLAGEGPQRGRLERAIARHCPGRDVALLGLCTRDALHALYAEADIFVLPSPRESFGLAALEARCAGLAVVALYGAGAAEFLHQGRSALMAGDDAELARHIARLALDDELRARLARPDPGLVRYAWPRVVAAHLAGYARAMALLGDGAAAAPALR